MTIYEAPNASRSAQAGAAFGGGLSQGLNMLLNAKMESMAAQKQQEQLGQMYESLGLPAELAGVPPGIAQELLKQQGQARKESSIQQILQKQGPQPGAVQMFAEGEGMEGLGALQEGLGAGLMAQAAQQEAGGSAYRPVQPETEEFTNAQIQQVSAIDPQRGRLLQMQKDTQKKVAQREKEAAYKETKEYRQQVRKDGTKAKQDITALDNMVRLIDSGKLTNPVLYSVLKWAGFDVPALRSKETQEFEKEQVRFLRNVGDVFKGKVSNIQMETFLKGMPNLEIDDSVKRKLADAMRIQAEAALLEEKTANEILAEHGGHPPPNLPYLVDQRLAPLLDPLAEKFSGVIESITAPGEGNTEGLMEGEIVMIDERGGRHAVPKSQAKEAKAAGWKLG